MVRGRGSERVRVVWQDQSCRQQWSANLRHGDGRRLLLRLVRIPSLTIAVFGSNILDDPRQETLPRLQGRRCFPMYTEVCLTVPPTHPNSIRIILHGNLPEPPSIWHSLEALGRVPRS